MNRPLERFGTDSIEAIFGREFVTENELLDLKEELEIRTSQRAKELMNKVVKKLAQFQKNQSSKGRPLVSANAPKPHEGIPVEIPELLPGQNPLKTAFEHLPSKPIPPLTAPHVEPSTLAVVMAMSRQQAFKVMKVPITASWEQIEQSRRELVSRAQPDKLAGLAAEKRRALQNECQEVNAAYKTVLRAKL